jgi:hypothetical protein
MAAEEDNKYAEKWTEQATLELLDRCHKAICDDCYFLSEVADAVEEYPDLFKYLARKFEGNEQVFRAIKRLYVKCEKIITRKTAEGKIVPSLGIFILKAYHELVETSKVQSEHSGSMGLTWNEVKNYGANPEANTGA